MSVVFCSAIFRIAIVINLISQWMLSIGLTFLDGGDGCVMWIFDGLLLEVVPPLQDPLARGELEFRIFIFIYICPFA